MTERDTTEVIPGVFSRVPVQVRVAPVLAAHLLAPSNSYLFVGPSGSGKIEWSLAFAAALMCSNGGCGDCSTCRSVMDRNNPDLNIFSNRDGSLSFDDARQAIRYSVLSPSTSLRRVVILEEFENIARVAPVLLKAIEEPPVTTVFILSASMIGKDMVTIASRCVKVDFFALDTEELESYLRQSGISVGEAHEAANLARGSLERALAFTAAGHFGDRFDLWKRATFARCRSGSELMQMVAEIVAFVDSVTAEKKAQGEARLGELKEIAKRSAGTKGAIREMEADLTRELRFGRRNEFELGFSIMLYLRKGDLDSQSAEIERGFREYEVLERRVTEALRLLRAGVAETLVLSVLLGGMS